MDAVAERYGVDPWTVAQWPDARLSLAVDALQARAAQQAEAAIRRKSGKGR